MKAKGNDILALCERLSDELSQRLQTRRDFHAGVAEAVSDLQSQGHDLWHINASEDLELWGPNYVHPEGPGLIATFKAPGHVDVEWSAR